MVSSMNQMASRTDWATGAVSYPVGRGGVIATLRREHEEVTALLAHMVEAYGRAPDARCEELMRRAEVELIAHARAEQRSFYATLARYPETAGLVRASKHEHDDVEGQLDRLISLGVAHPDWLEEVAILAGMVEEHVNDEETLVFERAERLLTGARLAELDLAFTREKVRQLRLLGA